MRTSWLPSGTPSIRPCSDGRKEPGWPCAVGSVLGRHRLRSRCHADDPDGLQIEQCRTGLRRWNQRVPSAPRRWLRVSDGIKQLEGECFCPDSLVHRLKSYAFDRKLDRDDRIFGIGRIRAWQIICLASEKAGIQKKGYAHLLRHSDAIERLRQTGNPKALQIHLGHSSPLMTMRYLSTLTAEDALKIQRQVEFD